MKQLRPSAAGVAPARPVSLARQIASVNRWRDALNPQRGLTMARAVSMIEAAMRGQHTELQWTYAAPLSGLESVDADTMALIELRRAELMKMDWNIYADQDASDPVLARDQRDFLDAVYTRIDNLYDAFAHLELGAFRGFSCCELVDAQGEASLLEAVAVRCLDAWNFVRDGSAGAWYWNPEARFVTAPALGEANRIDFAASALLFRECPRCINRYGLPKLIAANLCEKDWNAYVEIFGIERPIIIGPPDVPAEDRDAFAASMEPVADGGGGFIPNGSSVVYPGAQRGLPPFEARLAHLSRRHVQVGTAGMLNMLNVGGGVGGDASGALRDTFRTIASGSARYISEIFNRQLDRRLLALQFPGRPQLAWFRLAHEDKQDLKALADTIAVLAQAGLQWDAAEASDRFGLKLVRAAPALPDPGFRALNRAPAAAGGGSRPPDSGLVTQAVAQTLEARAEWLAPFFRSLEAKAADGQLTEEEFQAALEEAAAALPELFAAADAEAMARPLRDLLGTALVNTIATRPEGAP